ENSDMTCHDVKNETKEQKDLKWWQLSLIGIGCTIGTGFFLGSSIGIKIGGSSIILILILTGFTTYIVFEALAKMAVEEAISTNGVHSDWIYFYNPKTSTDKWITTRQTVAVIGNHVFAK
ncbi:cell wall hydrolase, partial [Bacillus thuringiensis]|uniref:cell wall hydrolase n=1 Tax=Bacillus thuringiensis TaxID=1428 RepID=UPI002DB60602